VFSTELIHSGDISTMRGVWTALILAAAVTVAADGAFAQSKPGAKPAPPKNPVAATAASVKAGQQVYAQQCRHCHGVKGLGDGPLAPSNPKPRNFAEGKWQFGSTDGDLFNVIWNGAPKPKSEMKGMKGTLAEKDVWNIVNFIRTLGPKTAPR
jgi:mono/diheme cytochrome c family protein